MLISGIRTCVSAICTFLVCLGSAIKTATSKFGSAVWACCAWVGLAPQRAAAAVLNTMSTPKEDLTDGVVQQGVSSLHAHAVSSEEQRWRSKGICCPLWCWLPLLLLLLPLAGYLTGPYLNSTGTHYASNESVAILPVAQDCTERTPDKVLLQGGGVDESELAAMVQRIVVGVLAERDKEQQKQHSITQLNITNIQQEWSSEINSMKALDVAGLSELETKIDLKLQALNADIVSSMKELLKQADTDQTDKSATQLHDLLGRLEKQQQELHDLRLHVQGMNIASNNLNGGLETLQDEVTGLANRFALWHSAGQTTQQAATELPLQHTAHEELATKIQTWQDLAKQQLQIEVKAWQAAHIADVEAGIASQHDAASSNMRAELSSMEERLMSQLKLQQDGLDAAIHAVLDKQLTQYAEHIQSKQTIHNTEQSDKLAQYAGKINALEDEIKDMLQKYNSVSMQLADIMANKDNSSSVLSDRVDVLRQALEDLQSSHAAILFKLGNCCKNDTALAILIQNQLDTLVGVPGRGLFGHGVNTASGVSLDGGVEGDGKTGGEADSVFAAWLQKQFSQRDEQLKFLTSRINEKTTQDSSTVNTATSGLSEEQVRILIRDALLIYGADKTGMVDYALESAGGSVLSTRCSETYQRRTAEFSLFGVPLWYSSNSPRTVIQPDMQPGQCWAFMGSEGYLVIQLSGFIKPTAFSYEHISKSMSPTGRIDSAPNHFTVWALQHEKDKVGVQLGNYTYNENGEPLQYFAVTDPDVQPTEFVELRIHSNHGNPEYTCLYRFRVHGTLVQW